MPEFGRLSPEFIASVEAAGWPKQRLQFLPWYRDVKGYHGTVERHWADLRLGKPVPYPIVAGFVEYMRERRGLAGAVLPANADRDGVWQSLGSVVHFCTGHFADEEAMYLNHRYKDSVSAAALIASCVGRKAGAVAGDELEVGQREMGIKVDQLSRWVATMWNAEFRSVMFAVAKGLRVGVSVFLPLKEQAFQAVCSGDIGCWGLTPDDLESPSKFLFLTVLAEPPLPDGISVKVSSGAQVRTAFYQASYLTRGVKRPVLLAPATNPQYAARLRRHGYREVGAMLGGTDKPLYVLRHPSEIDGPKDQAGIYFPISPRV